MKKLPSTANEAKATGAKLYFTGRPCSRGHVAPRYAHGSCTACKAEDREKLKDERALYAREWRKRNSDKTKGYHQTARESGYGKSYYLRNKEDQIAKALAWNRANPDRAKEHCRTYRQNHPEKMAELSRAYYEANRDEVLAKGASYRSERRESRAAATREWRRANPEKARIADRNKKVRRKGAEGTHTLEDIRAIFARQKNKCAECGINLSRGHHIDHIQPLSRGGSNWPKNLQALCPTCNLQKHASDPIDFARKKGRLL